MASMTTTATAAVLACTTAGLLVVGQRLHAQGGDRSAIAAALFAGLDGNKDGALSRDEARASAEQWFTAWKPADADGLSSESVIFGLSRVLPVVGPAVRRPQREPAHRRVPPTSRRWSPRCPRRRLPSRNHRARCW